MCNDLLFFHAFTDRDSTSRIFGISKKSGFQNNPQKFIDGVEFTIFVDCKENGDLKAIIPIKILNKKGITLAGESNNNNDNKFC